MVNDRVDTSHGEISHADRSIGGIFCSLLEPKAIGEELQKLCWEKVIEFLKISIVQRDDAEIVLAKELQLGAPALVILRVVEPPVFDIAIANGHVEICIRLLGHGKPSFVGVGDRRVPRIEPVVDEKFCLRSNPVPVRAEEVRGKLLSEIRLFFSPWRSDGFLSARCEIEDLLDNFNW